MAATLHPWEASAYEIYSLRNMRHRLALHDRLYFLGRRERPGTEAAAMPWIMTIRIMATTVETTVTMVETMTTIIKSTRQSAR